MDIIRSSSLNWNKFAWYAVKSRSSMPMLRYGVDYEENSTEVGLPQIPYGFIKLHKIKYSFFNVSKGYDDMEIVYNTASDAVVALTKQESEDVKRYSEDDSFVPHNIDLLEKLYGLGLFVRKDDNEIDRVHLVRKRLMVQERGIKSFIICPTYECNARCFFCLAHDDLRNSYRMSIEIADDVLNYIYGQVCGEDDVIFYWFGGEPLIAEDIIDYIVENFNAHYKGQVKFSSVIQTNGSLLTDNLLLKAINLWHAKEIQISIDGYQEEHDKRKNYKNITIHQYEQVLSNIERIIKNNLRCLVRLHLDNRNLGDYPKILDDLCRFKDNSNFKLYTTTLHVPEHVTEYDSYVHFSQFNDFYNHIFRELFSREFVKDISSIIPHRILNLCFASSTESVLVGADGKLFKCEQEDHDDEHCVGDCKSGVIQNEHLSVFMDVDVDARCVKCKFLPICQGGCKYYWSRNNPDVSPCVRQVHYMDTIFNYIHNWITKKEN